MIGRAVRMVLTGLSPRRTVMILSLVATWCVLWGAVSAANVLSGAVVALVVTAPGLGDPLPGGFRLVPLLRLSWVVLVDSVKSTVEVSGEILTPGDQSSESIVAITVPPRARRHMLFYTAAITLTPGTVVVDTDVEAGILYIHLLHDINVAAGEALVQRLAELACEAFPAATDGPLEPGRSAGDAG